MSARGLAAGAAALALLWGGAGYLVSKPDDVHDYRVAATGAAQTAHDAVVTAALAGNLLQAGRVVRPYAETIWSDGRDALAGAEKRLAAVRPADERTEAMRDEVGPLLISAGAALDAIAGGDAGAGDQVADALEAFGEAHTP